jgi:hypothetical protein
LITFSALGGATFFGVAQYAQPFVMTEVNREFGAEAMKKLKIKYTIQVRQP